MSFAVDANILVYASDRSSPVQARASRFLRSCAEGNELFCLAWSTISAYLRIATHSAVFSRPLAPAEAMAQLAARIPVRPSPAALAARSCSAHRVERQSNFNRPLSPCVVHRATGKPPLETWLKRSHTETQRHRGTEEERENEWEKQKLKSVFSSPVFQIPSAPLWFFFF